MWSPTERERWERVALVVSKVSYFLMERLERWRERGRGRKGEREGGRKKTDTMSKNVSLELLEQQKSCVKNRTEFCAVGSIPEEGPAVTRGWFTRVRGHWYRTCRV